MPRRLEGLRSPLDFLLASLLLALLAPAILILGFAVCGWQPIFFTQVRVGRRGQTFRLFKLRTMRVNAHDVLVDQPELYRRYVEGGFKLRDDHDPRLLPLAVWIRRTGLDELPQLWNVLRGEMRLVGPRPIVPDELSVYPDFCQIMDAVHPGITCLWQVSNVPSSDYEGRAALDQEYVQTRSLALDLRILLRTVARILRLPVNEGNREQGVESIS